MHATCLSHLLLLLMTSALFRGERLHRSFSEDTDDLTVMTDKGRVRGVRYYEKRLNLSVASFLGIPFAEPPVGNLRFKHPQPKAPWNDLLLATSLPNSCYQNPDLVFGDFYGSSMWNSPTPVSEDCLYLNVWVPDTHPRPQKSAVLVWIFGGGFYSGTTTLDLYDGKLLAFMNNIIVVSVGYRVGAMGFLTPDHAEAPGNAGLFDQLMALDWVQQNIHRFGGDPQNVTIFGESAGAVSVSTHLLSPLSRNKFQRAIMQSGSAAAPWATYNYAEGRRRALRVAQLFECEFPDNMELTVSCLRNIDAQSIVDEQWISRGVAQFPFVPVIDGVFLVEHPLISLREGRFKRCPILLGSNRNEGAFFNVYEMLDHVNLNRQLLPRKFFLHTVDSLFFHYPQWSETQSDNPRTLVLDSIAFQYSDWHHINDTYKNFEALDQATGDAYFVCGVNALAHAYAAHGHHVFYYFFSQRFQSNPWPEFMGVLHGDEILFVFGEPFKTHTSFTDDEKRLSRKMMQYWTNFARSG